MPWVKLLDNVSLVRQHRRMSGKEEPSPARPSCTIPRNHPAAFSSTGADTVGLGGDLESAFLISPQDMLMPPAGLGITLWAARAWEDNPKGTAFPFPGDVQPRKSGVTTCTADSFAEQSSTAPVGRQHPAAWDQCLHAVACAG